MIGVSSTKKIRSYLAYTPLRTLVKNIEALLIITEVIARGINIDSQRSVALNRSHNILIPCRMTEHSIATDLKVS